MSYKVQAIMAHDNDLLLRIASCVTRENIQEEEDPLAWAHLNSWFITSDFSWVDAYKYALARGITRPGNDESVITDGMILSAVQARIQELMHPEEPNPE